MAMSSSGRAHQRASASIGRVGGLAVALGIGAAVATGLAAPASADSTGAADAATSVSARTSNSHHNRAATRSVTSRTKAVVASAAAVRQPARRAAAHGIQTPSAPVAASTAVNLLAAAGRELGRTFLNQYPTTAPSITSQSADGVVTGTLGASDPEGDRLVYTVVGKPSLGRVSIDQATGDFTYTSVVDVASYGGTDAFTVSVSDETNFHIHGLQGLLDAPIRLLRAIPFVGSLLSDYLPSTNTTATVKLTFDGDGTVAALSFPEGFHWGVSTAGFQSEMGGGAPLDVNSDWWQWLHDPINKLLLGWKGGVPENG
ncbi:MAG: Ig-like domain-containing protein, partial [Mycobacterium sp.]